MSNPFTIIKEKLIEASKKETIQGILRDIVEENGHILEDLNRDQLFKGKNIDGTDIEPEYTDFTKQLKALKGQPSDRVTLKDTGDLYASIRVKTFDQAFELVATDPKTPELFLKYGKLWLGLSDESKAIFVNEIVRPELTQRLRKLFDLI